MGDESRTALNPEASPFRMPSSTSTEMPARPNTASSSALQSRNRRHHNRSNANHLLNFQSTSIVGQGGRGQQRGRHSVDPRHKTNRKPKRLQKFSKELFVQAKFRFLISDMSELAQDSTNSLTSIDWDDVVHVETSESAHPQCPICLDEEEMICAQVTPCGHIFCSPCLARYCVDEEGVLSFHLNKKCPICYAKFSPSTVRSVKFRIVTKPATGEELTFSLIKRRRGSTIPVPVVRESDQSTRLLEVSRSPGCKNARGSSDRADVTEMQFPFSDEGAIDLFSRFTLTSIHSDNKTIERIESVITDIIERETPIELRDTLPYLTIAIDALRMRIDSWRRRREGLIAAQADPHLALEMRVHGLRVSLNSSDKQPKKHEGEGNLTKALKSNDDYKAKSATHSSTEQPPASSDGANNNTEIKVDSSYLWSYQAKDGQLVFVHPLNMRCLQVHFGAYAKMPPELTGRVLEVETWAQDEETLKRWPHLAHLPLTSTLELCEVHQLKPSSRKGQKRDHFFSETAKFIGFHEWQISMKGLVSPESMESVSQELALREKRRKKREKDAIRARAKASAKEKDESEKMRHAIKVLNMQGSQTELPFTDIDFVALSDGSPTTAPVEISQGVSFARIAELGFAAEGVSLPGANKIPSPTRESSGAHSHPSVDTAPSPQQTAWTNLGNTPAHDSSSSKTQPLNWAKKAVAEPRHRKIVGFGEEDIAADEEDDDCCAPSFQESFLQSARLNVGEASSSRPKGKKKGKVTLFSTSSNRKY